MLLSECLGSLILVVWYSFHDCDWPAGRHRLILSATYGCFTFVLVPHPHLAIGDARECLAACTSGCLQSNQATFLRSVVSCNLTGTVEPVIIFQEGIYVMHNMMFLYTHVHKHIVQCACTANLWHWCDVISTGFFCS